MSLVNSLKILARSDLTVEIWYSPGAPAKERWAVGLHKAGPGTGDGVMVTGYGATLHAAISKAEEYAREDGFL